MIVTCPYCHKKMHVSARQLLFKGRLSVACPACRRQVYRALQRQLQAVQVLMVLVALLLFALLSRLQIPGGSLGVVLVLLAGMFAVVALNELCCRWVARDSMLRYRTERLVEREKQQEAAQKAAEKAKKKHKKK